jgi:protein-S-isoprenylcysteine O-methyltransferase Ste14
MIVLKALIFTVVAPGTVALLVPYLLLTAYGSRFPLPLGVFSYLGLIFILLGCCVYLWCAWDFATAGRGTPAPIDPPKELVVRSLYRFVRNPMYMGVLLLLIGEALLFESSLILIYASLVFLAFHLFVIVYEEPTLRKKFGSSYERYCSSVPRWVPRIR